VKIAQYLLIILIPPVLILGNFRYLIFNADFYQKIQQKIGVYRSFDNHEIVDLATENLFGFFKGNNQLDFEFYSRQAQLHLFDVKQILYFTFGFFYILLVAVTTIILVMSVRRSKKNLASAFLISAIVTFLTILVLALGILRSFDAFFLKFHQVAFTNDFWQFGPDDNLIKLFPIEFFVEFANRLAVNIALTSVVVTLVSVAVLKRLSR